jgi:hypothetical protein
MEVYKGVRIYHSLARIGFRKKVLYYKESLVRLSFIYIQGDKMDTIQNAFNNFQDNAKENDFYPANSCKKEPTHISDGSFYHKYVGPFGLGSTKFGPGRLARRHSAVPPTTIKPPVPKIKKPPRPPK